MSRGYMILYAGIAIAVLSLLILIVSNVVLSKKRKAIMTRSKND